MDFSKIKLDSGSSKKKSGLEGDASENVGGENVVERGEVVKSENGGGLRFDKLKKFGSNSSIEEKSTVVAGEDTFVESGVGEDFGGFEVVRDEFVDDVEFEDSVSNPFLEDEDGGEENGLVSKVGGSVVGETFRGFDETLRDLLEDDDEEFGGVESGVSVNGVSDVENVVRDSVRVVKSGKGGVGKSESSAGRGKSKSVKKFGKSVVHGESIGGLDNEVARRGAVEYLVDGGGNVVKSGGGNVVESGGAGFGKLVEAVESGKNVTVSESLVDRSRGSSKSVVGDGELDGRVVFPWSMEGELRSRDVRVKSKINQKELDFYRRLGVGKSELWDDEVLKSVVRGGVKSGKPKSGAVRVGVSGHRGYSRLVESSVTGADFELLKFLAKFRYARSSHLALLSGVREQTVHKRLVRLEKKGLVDRWSLWGAGVTWVLTSAGMLVSGFELPVVKLSTLSYMLVPHQFVVNNTAGSLWGGTVNVLNLDEFPVKNRVDSNGKRVFGEELVSETELLSSLAKVKEMSASSVYRPRVVKALDSSFREWNERGGVSSGFDSPEFEVGNEWMWVLFPPFNLKLSYHVPDLVVKRERNSDGTPESIAVEIELDSKLRDRYRRTLEAYRADKRIYKKVIWVCKSLSTARSLEKMAKEVGLWQEGRIDIVPILTGNGIFEGRDLWKI